MATLVGKKAPLLQAPAVVDGQIVSNFSLESYYGKYVLLFFYPLDFTFVCPTELHAFQERLSEFEQRSCQVVGCSVDSAHCHQAWLRTPKSQGGIQGVTYPLVADVKRTVVNDYDVLCEEEGIAYRGLFLIDRDGIVRHQLINDLPLGRSLDEAIRMLDALIFFEQHGEVCPANWQEGKVAMKPTLDGVSQYFAVSNG